MDHLMSIVSKFVKKIDSNLNIKKSVKEFQDLNLDSETLQMLKDSSEHEQVDPACESQLLS